nr:hypothetical protein [Candidatus Accumulibacter contiguus]
MIEASRSRDKAETEIACQIADDRRGRAQEFPVGQTDAVLSGEVLQRGRRVERLIETDADHVEAIGTHDADRILDGFLQVAGGRRADLEAGGVDEVDQQRLASVTRQFDRLALAIEEYEVSDRFADGALREFESSFFRRGPSVPGRC